MKYTDHKCSCLYADTKVTNLNINIMTPSNGNIYRITGPLRGEFTGDRWIPLSKVSDAELWCFSLICVWTNGWVNNRNAGDLRRHRVHYDVTLMKPYCSEIGIFQENSQYRCWCPGSLRRQVINSRFIDNLGWASSILPRERISATWTIFNKFRTTEVRYPGFVSRCQLSRSRKKKCRHFDDVFVTGCTGS